MPDSATVDLDASDAVFTAAASPSPLDHEKARFKRIDDRTATVAVVGLGHVGWPLAVTVASAGFKVLAIDIDAAKIATLNAGRSGVSHVSSRDVQGLVDAGSLSATNDPRLASAADIVLLCLPTPLDSRGEPDLGPVVSGAEALAPCLRPGQLVVLESTTFPGTTTDIVRPILEKTGLKSGSDFFLAYSPQRLDPGNLEFSPSAIPKIVSGDGQAALALVSRFYGSFMPSIVPVSSTKVAETAKLVENVFRSVNLALANELKTICEAMSIDVWEVIEAAKSKPFGFMAFYPGPGVGGHCIPVDPVYLSWFARKCGATPDFIELATAINASAPDRIAARLSDALRDRSGLPLDKSRILIVGLAYKRNVDDIRQSPGLDLMAIIEDRGARVDYFDPHVPCVGSTPGHERFAARASVAWHPDGLASYQAAIVVTDHDGIDYRALREAMPLILDTRNVMARLGLDAPHIIKA